MVVKVLYQRMNCPFFENFVRQHFNFCFARCEPKTTFTRDRTNPRPYSNSSGYSCSHETGQITGQKVFTRSRTNSCPKLFTKLCCRCDTCGVFLDADILPFAKRRFAQAQLSKIVVIESQLLKNPFSIHF